MSASESNAQNVGREGWTSDNGSTHHYTGDATEIYDCLPIPVGGEHVLIGDKKHLPVIAVGSLNLRIHQDGKSDFDAQLTNGNVVKGMGYNLFSLHDLKRRHVITLAHQGVHIV